MSKVTLAVYDLSMGMARQLGPQLLGMDIDMIPHTGVVVYGQEYFFGGGIQSLPHEQFAASHMPPVQMLDMGETEVPKELFEEFLNEIRPRFTMQTYNLISNNCNNFSNEVTNFLLGASIPASIIELPQRVFSSPMGMQLRPMVEQMQGSIQGGGAIPGFGPGGAGAGAFPPAAAMPPPSFAVPAAPAAASAPNPWASVASPPTAPTPTLPAAAPAAAANPVRAAASAPVTPAPAPSTPVERNAKPLLSTNTSIVPTLVKKLKNLGRSGPPSSPSSPSSTSSIPTSPSSPAGAAAAAGSPATPGDDAAPPPIPLERSQSSTDGLMSSGDLATLDRLAEALQAGANVPVQSFSLILKVLQVWPSRGVRGSEFPALCLLRLVVLQPSAYTYMQGDSSSRLECLSFVVNRLAARGAEAALKESAKDIAGVAMALAVLSNLFALPSGVSFVMTPHVREKALDAVLRELHLPRTPTFRDVRQMASAALHNFALHVTEDVVAAGAAEDLPEMTTQILCGALDELQSETDVLVCERRLLTVAHVIQLAGPKAATLVSMLGLDGEVAAITFTEAPVQAAQAKAQTALDAAGR